MLQGYILPTLGLLAFLKPDGMYYLNPWLDNTTPASVHSPTADSSPPKTTEQAGQNSHPSAQDLLPSSEPDPQQLLAAASARLSQRSTAERAHVIPVQEITSAGKAASQQAQSSTQPSLEELQPNWGQGFQQGLVQSAAALVSKSPLPRSRFQAMSWLTLLVPQLTERGCTDVANSEAVQASVRLIQQESEPARTRAAAVEFCLTLHGRGALPIAVLLEAGVHQHLTKIVAWSGVPNWYSSVRPCAPQSRSYSPSSHLHQSLMCDGSFFYLSCGKTLYRKHLWILTLHETGIALQSASADSSH